jgi:hypothetical protein
VIAPDIAFDGIDPAAWSNALKLLAPPSRGGGRSRAPLILFIEGGACVKAARIGEGRIDPATIEWTGPHSLGKVRRAIGAPIAAALEAGALDKVVGTLEGRLDGRADLAAQWMEGARILKAELGKTVHLDPDPLSLVPVPSFDVLQRTYDALIPDDSSVGLFVFDRGELWTSLIGEKRSGDVVRVTTHAALGVARPDFRGGRQRELLDAMARNVARPFAALFATREAWRAISGPEPGALARQLAAREAVLDPAPPWLLALTGAGAALGVAAGASRLLGRFVPDAVKQAAQRLSPFAALGFDPLEVFTKIRKMF